MSDDGTLKKESLRLACMSVQFQFDPTIHTVITLKIQTLEGKECRFCEAANDLDLDSFQYHLFSFLAFQWLNFLCFFGGIYLFLKTKQNFNI